MPTDLATPRLQPEKGAQNEEVTRVSEDQEARVSLLDLLIVLGEHRAWIVWCTLGAAAFGLILALVLPSIYTATVSLLPPQQSSSVGSALAGQLGNLGGLAALAGGSLGIKNPNDMFVAMLKSRTVEDAMVQRFNLQKEYRKRYLSDTRLAFEKHASVDGNNKDGLIHISVEDRDPKRAAELANGYVEQFRDLSEHLAITEAGQRRLFFEKQLEQAKDNLAAAEEALKLTEQKTGLIQLDSQARALIESAATLRGQIVAKEVQVQSLRTFATSENAQLIQAQQELDTLREQLAKLGGSESSSDANLIVPKGQVPQAGLEYVRKLRDVKYNETIFEILARQYEIAKLDEAKQGALIQVVDSAIPPDKRSFPRIGIFLLAGALGGLMIGVCLALGVAAMQSLEQDAVTHAKVRYLKRLLLGRSLRKA